MSCLKWKRGCTRREERADLIPHDGTDGFRARAIKNKMIVSTVHVPTKPAAHPTEEWTTQDGRMGKKKGSDENHCNVILV